MRIYIRHATRVFPIDEIAYVACVKRKEKKRKEKERKKVPSTIPDSFVFADSPRKGRLPLSPKKTTRALGSLFIEIMFRYYEKNQTAREHLFLLYMYGNVRCSLYYYFTYSLSFRFSLILLDFFFFFS